MSDVINVPTDTPTGVSINENDDDSKDVEHIRRKIIGSLISYDGVISHHVDSYDKFLSVLVKFIIDENSLIMVEVNGNTRHIVKIKNVFIRPCQFSEENGTIRDLGPRECILRKQTYECAVNVTVVYNVEYRVLRGSTPNPVTLINDDGTEWVIGKQVITEKCIVQIPLMTRAGFCITQDRPDFDDVNRQFEYGGSFIINGAEKVIIPQEKLKINTIFVFGSTDSKYSLVAEIRSLDERKLRSTSTLTVLLSDSNGVKRLWVGLPYIEKPLPITAVIALAGFTSIEEFSRSVSTAGRSGGKTAVPKDLKHLQYWIMSVVRTEQYDKNVPDFFQMSYTAQIEWVGQFGTKKTSVEDRYKHVHHLMSNEFFPHISNTNTPGALLRKRHFFAFMVHRLVTSAMALQKNPDQDTRDKVLDDRDSYTTKKVETAGTLLALCFRQNWRISLMSILNLVRKAVKLGGNVAIGEIISMVERRMTDNIRYAMATGKWGSKRGGSTQTGVSQVLKKNVAISLLGNLRRLNHPINREGRNPRPRMLHASHWNIVCPATTPEGLPCGLVKSLACGARITTGCLPQPMSQIIMSALDIKQLPGSSYSFNHAEFIDELVPNVDFIPTDVLDSYQEVYDKTSLTGPTTFLHINGTPYGLISDVGIAIITLRTLRSKLFLPKDVSIWYDANCDVVNVMCEDGGFRRPILMPKFNKDEFKSVIYRHPGLWEWASSTGRAGYIDKCEEAGMVISLNPENGEQCSEIHPILMFSETASQIVYSNHNPTPRNTYQSNMGQAAIGLGGDTYYRAMSYELTFVERPLVSTFMQEMLSLDTQPAGQNIVVAVMCHEYNQDDSCVVNRRMLDLGYFRCIFTRSYSDTIRSMPQSAPVADGQVFGKPNREKTTDLIAANYDKLSSRGVPLRGTPLTDGDIIIGKQTAVITSTNDEKCVTWRDQSMLVKRGTQDCVVDSVMFTNCGKGRTAVNVRTRSMRTPEEGDKFSSRHGQKGTVGKIVDDIDMPFTAMGVRPSMIINPIAFASRMTIGHLIECLKAKVSAYRGEFGDGTPFQKIMTEEMGKELINAGLSHTGKERMRNGMTGEEFEADIFIGPTYYQRLRQMVQDKVHARSRGPREVLSRQAAEGRARSGGLRVGEMERDAIAAHGAAEILLDRFLYESDDAVVIVCGVCGMLAEPAAPPIQKSQKYEYIRARKPYCRMCRSHVNLHRVRIAYNMKLLIQEALTMNVVLRLVLEKPSTIRDTRGCAAIGMHVPDDAIRTNARNRETRDETLRSGAYGAGAGVRIPKHTSGVEKHTSGGVEKPQSYAEMWKNDNESTKQPPVKRTRFVTENVTPPANTNTYSNVGLYSSGATVFGDKMWL